MHFKYLLHILKILLSKYSSNECCMEQSNKNIFFAAWTDAMIRRPDSGIAISVKISQIC